METQEEGKQLVTLTACADPCGIHDRGCGCKTERPSEASQQ